MTFPTPRHVASRKEFVLPRPHFTAVNARTREFNVSGIIWSRRRAVVFVVAPHLADYRDRAELGFKGAPSWALARSRAGLEEHPSGRRSSSRSTPHMAPAGRPRLWLSPDDTALVSFTHLRRGSVSAQARAKEVSIR